MRNAPQISKAFNGRSNRFSDRNDPVVASVNLVPEQVLLMLIGKMPSVEALMEAKVLKAVSDRATCLIDASGQVYERRKGQLVECRRCRTSNGRVYYPFPYHEDDVFKLWAMRAVYRAFVGEEPKGYRVEPIDGDHDNCRLDNLMLVRKEEYA